MTPPASVRIRELRSLEDCRAVVAIQEAVWGRDGETVPASVLMVSAKRGGILLGASTSVVGGATEDASVVGGLQAAEPLVGFVWSMPGVRDDGKRTHWSHMLGVLPEYREQRLGERLKWAQRERALQQGAEMIEWTFDPLQAANAHFNLHVLGGVGASYGIDIYGALAGPLHRGTPTDRLIVEWNIAEPHVVRRHSVRHAGAVDARLQARSAEVLAAPIAIETVERDGWVQAATVTNSGDDRRILLPIPPKFLAMQQEATDIALAWRLAVRGVMTDALSRGYRAVDFLINRERGGGAYLLARDETP
jgi:predicted GNAT superfamily acetyltransferase